MLSRLNLPCMIENNSDNGEETCPEIQFAVCPALKYVAGSWLGDWADGNIAVINLEMPRLYNLAA